MQYVFLQFLLLNNSKSIQAKRNLRQQNSYLMEQQNTSKKNITIPVEAVIKWVLDAVDCLLMMESLKEDSLMEEEMHCFRGVGDRNRRQGNFSARVILTKAEKKQACYDF